MYRKFFGLSKFPFQSSPDVDIFYKSGSRQDILEALVYTVSRGDGITKVTGEVGSGKTMLLRLLADSLPPEFKVLYINTPNLSPKDMLMHICSELGLSLDGQTFKYALLDRINKELVRLYSGGQRVVMLIDEAQAMTFDTLEEIRLLSNLETNDGKLLQIVLFGQPELDVALANDKIRQLKSRISYSIFIPALTPKEVCAYLNYRLRKASYEGLDIFDLRVSIDIYKRSKGIPRAINMIADKLLMAAYSLGDTKVTKKHLAMLPSEVGVKGERYGQQIKVIFFFLLVAVFITGIYFALTSPVMSSFFSLNGESRENRAQEASAPLNLKELDVGVQSTELKEKEAIVESRDEVGTEVDKESVELKLNSDSLVRDGVKSSERLFSLESSDGLVKDGVKSSSEQLSNLENSEGLRIKGALLSKRLLDLHSSTVEWLADMPEQMYLIQLASPHVNALNEALAFYKGQGLPMDSIHVLIDLGRLDQKNRFRVFYLASASYSTLERIISELPSEVLKSNPYIVTAGGVFKNLEYTQDYLKQHGIINVN